MSPNPLVDFRLELFTYPANAGAGTEKPPPVDLTDRFLLEGVPTVSQAVERDLSVGGEAPEIDCLVKGRGDTLIWDQTKQFVEVTGGSFVGLAGEKDFVAEGLAVESPYVPNEFYALALAEAYHAFFSRRRAHVEVAVRDTGRAYLPLERVVLGGQRYLVYESDHDLGDLEHRLRLIEDV